MSQDPSPRDTRWERETLEKLAFASLREQRAARRWKVALRLLWLAFLVTMVVWWMREVHTPQVTSSSPHTAVIEVRGEIAADAEANAPSLIAALQAAFDDPGAQGVVLLINSPGGSPVQAGMVHDEIQRLKALHDKPVHAVVEETCASAAYYIAAAADNIYVDKASIVGSIGVLMNGFGFTGLIERLGVERRLMTAGDNKGFMDPFSPVNEVQRAHAQALLDDIHAQFIAVVKAGRGDRLKAGPEVFSGLVWSGQKAVEMGLADDLGSLEQVAREVLQAEEIMDYTEREGVAERLMRRFGAGVGESALLALRDAGWGWR